MIQAVTPRKNMLCAAVLLVVWSLAFTRIPLAVRLSATEQQAAAAVPSTAELLEMPVQICSNTALRRFCSEHSSVGYPECSGAKLNTSEWVAFFHDHVLEGYCSFAVRRSDKPGLLPVPAEATEVPDPDVDALSHYDHYLVLIVFLWGSVGWGAFLLGCGYTSISMTDEEPQTPMLTQRSWRRARRLKMMMQAQQMSRDKMMLFSADTQ